MLQNLTGQFDSSTSLAPDIGLARGLGVVAHMQLPTPNGWRLSGEGGAADRVRCSRGLGRSRLRNSTRMRVVPTHPLFSILGLRSFPKEIDRRTRVAREWPRRYIRKLLIDGEPRR